MTPHLVVALVAALAALGIVLRPLGWPEAVWAVGAAALLVAAGLLAPMAALAGLARGTDVYLFLAGMMLLAEIAKAEGLFDWLAARAAALAAGSPTRLFLLVYLVGIGVTIFMSNDATAVVLTPAVAAAVRTARVARPLPYLLVCAFVANAASFVLPISNPANLVLYGARMPPLTAWLPLYLPASLVAVAATWGALRFALRADLRGAIASDVPRPVLSASGKLAAAGIGATALILLAASAAGLRLGWPTAAAGCATTLAVLARARKSPWPAFAQISWSVLFLVAGLFVLVQALDQAGLIGALAADLSALARASPALAAWSAGGAVALAGNLMNNLPVSLIAGALVQNGRAAPAVTRSLLVGVDLGPNLSITGSLATILWLTALRREGHGIGALAFLKLGLIVAPPALILAIATTLVFH